MENASKALIIAGAILISIILISIGIMVITQSNTMVDKVGSTMDEQAITAFNTKFLNYTGRQRGSTVRALMQSVISSNATDSNQVIVKFNGTETDPQALMSQLGSSTYYTLSCDIGGKEDPVPGLVKGINITDGKDSGAGGGGAGETEH